MRDKIYLAIGILIVVWSFYAVLQKPSPAHYQDLAVLKIGSKELIVEVADTEKERRKGLSERASLSWDHGLLFVFETPGIYGFWMKDMNFPIDIVWLDENLEVIDIEKNVTPGTFPHVFYPPRPVKYVLEVNPGEIK